MAATGHWGAVLADFRPHLLHPPLPQRLLLEHTVSAMAMVRALREGALSDAARQKIHEEVASAVDRFGVPPSIIAQRQTCCIEPTVMVEGKPRYPEPLSGIFAELREKPDGPQLDMRMKRFRMLAEKFLAAHYAADAVAPADIVHVSTSGYLLPSPVQRFVSARRWDATTVTHSYHMGCYGAFPGVRTALGLLASRQLSGVEPGRVDVLHTEAVSLHLDPIQVTAGNLVTGTLFGDGFIGYSAYTEAEATKRGVRGLKVIAAHEQIIPNSTEDMTLEPGPHQFDMHLSMRVPLRIRDGIGPFVSELCRKAGIDFEAERDRLYLGIHPGGTKILQVVADALGVDGARMETSSEVLRDHGNMASATIPHVWHRIVNDERVATGTRIVTAAFGPGLTVTGLVLEKT